MDFKEIKTRVNAMIDTKMNRNKNNALELIELVEASSWDKDIQQQYMNRLDKLVIHFQRERLI